MKKTALAAAVAALTLVAVSASQAAPIASLAAGTSFDHSNLTQVQYWRYHHRHWCYWHPRRCHW